MYFYLQHVPVICFVVPMVNVSQLVKDVIIDMTVQIDRMKLIVPVVSNISFNFIRVAAPY